ncbi:hypothetical protein GQX74_003339 [Glossina fuscipes]|nr:hypothetical protein GQX74_003339 [Glossina fuscipes]
MINNNNNNNNNNNSFTSKCFDDYAKMLASANSGGKRGLVIRNQPQWALCLAPNERNSGILASRAGINCSACVEAFRERTICTRNASVIRSLVRAIIFDSDIPGRSEANNTMAENKPISVSLKP